MAYGSDRQGKVIVYVTLTEFKEIQHALVDESKLGLITDYGRAIVLEDELVEIRWR